MLFMSCAGRPAMFPAITAAAKSGKTSIELRWAPRARVSWFQTWAGSWDLKVSRFVRGLDSNVSLLLGVWMGAL